MNKNICASCFFLILLNSCGVGPGPQFKNYEEANTDGSSIEGIYTADLIPLNINLHLMKVGSVAIERYGDQITFGVHLKYGPAGITHKQGIYSGTRCPNIFDDTNKDAYIDFLEAQPAIGGLLIPLDGDINSQKEGNGRFPISAMDGKYTYQMSGSFDQLLTDLKNIDENLEDNIIKISPEEGFSLEGKILIVQSASEETVLPSTVAEADGTSKHKSLPFACAIIRKGSEIPQELSSFSGINQLSIPAEDSAEEQPEEDVILPSNSPLDPWYRRIWNNLRNSPFSDRISTSPNDHQNL
jgi:hypothetical protein